MQNPDAHPGGRGRANQGLISKFNKRSTLMRQRDTGAQGGGSNEPQVRPSDSHRGVETEPDHKDPNTNRNQVRTGRTKSGLATGN